MVGGYDNINEPKPEWNKASTIIGLTSTAVGLSSGCIIFRLYVRLFLVKSPGWDDLFVFLYLLTGVAGSICLCLAPQWGLGQHFIGLTKTEIQSFLKLFYVSNGCHTMSTAMIKMSLLFQYIRIFQGGALRALCVSVMAITCIWGLAYTFMAWFPCLPPRGFWDRDVAAQCYGFGSADPNGFFAVYTSHNIINILIDLVVFGIPIPLYFQKDTPRRTRLGLLGLFCGGALVTALSMWRLETIVTNKASAYPTFDPTWYSPSTLLLGMLEVNAASICASVPVFWPVLTAQMDEIFVTREIKITMADRLESRRDDEIELRSSICDSRKGQLKLKRVDSLAFSEASQNHILGTSPVDDYHYGDDFILDQVDPLRKSTFLVKSEVVSAFDDTRRQRAKSTARPGFSTW